MSTGATVRDSLSRAQASLRSGDAAGAEAAFRQALVADPRNGEACLGLGRLMIAGNRAPSALPFLRVAAQERPKDVETQFLVARCEGLCGNFREAAGCLEALRAVAGGEPDVHSALIDVLERAGELDEATAAVEEAVRRFPGNVEIAVLAARLERRRGLLEQAAARLRGIDDRAGRPADQAQRFNELGQVEDKMNRPAAAFEAFSHANRWFAEVYRRRRIPEGILERQIAEMTAYVERTPADDLKPLDAGSLEWGELVQVPHFIVGFLRSGTTLLHQMLGARQDVHVVDERPMALQVRSFVNARKGGYPDALTDIDRDAAAGMRAVYAKALMAELAEAGVGSGAGDPFRLTVVDKFPMNIVRVPMLHRMGGGARFVVAVRDPLDVCLSCFMQPFQPSAVTRPFLDLAETARVYTDVMTLWLDYAEKAAPNAHVARYESIVDDPEAETRKICDFLGLSWAPEMLRFDEHAKRESAILNPSYHQVTRPLYRDALERWRRYEAQLAEIMDVLQPVRRRLGYES